MKYSEDRILTELNEYILKTYEGHYSKQKFQATEFIIDADQALAKFWNCAFDCELPNIW